MTYFLSIFFGTFLLEDLALATALKLVADGKINLLFAFAACFLGIGVGDLALYIFGYLIQKWQLQDKFSFLKKLQKKFPQISTPKKEKHFLTYTIVLSRFIPGTRTPTYLISGFLKYPFWRFTVLTVVTVFFWVLLAFATGHALKNLLAEHWLLGVALFLFTLHLIKSIIPKLNDYWSRRALLHSWRKWLSFEFWPATFFYLPIVPYYIYQSLKHLNFFMPFYANPEIENGGIIGESKWDFLKYLSSESPHVLHSVKINPQQYKIAEVKELLSREKLSYPFILKPDVGQRGFGVRIIRNDFELESYLNLASFDLIAQELSRYPHEAGLFYIRKPTEKTGFIFSITDKVFPSVAGNGTDRLGDLILQDTRARIIASTYFERHKENLSTVPSNNEIISLSECGNHCQGAIFKNGEKLKTAALENTLNELALQIPNFYFGRFDIKYKDPQSLMQGSDFEVVEVNGAGAEATHIWDAKTTLIEAYRSLFNQWAYLFNIGAIVKKQNLTKPIYPFRFFKESFKVYFRKDPLSRSS